MLHRLGAHLKVPGVEPDTYGGQFTLSTQLINPKFCVSRPHRCSTTVSLETSPLVCLLTKIYVICLKITTFQHIL